jgi:hypothetical protein
MSLEVYGEGKLGEIFIEDQRPDGSVVMLVCTQVARRAVGRILTAEGAAAIPVAGPDLGAVGVAASSSADGSTYPVFRERGMVRQRYKLHVDTTNLPGGVLRFAMNAFTRASLRAAENGEREVHLDPSNAEAFGYIGPLPTPFDIPQPEGPPASVAPSDAAATTARTQADDRNASSADE